MQVDKDSTNALLNLSTCKAELRKDKNITTKIHFISQCHTLSLSITILHKSVELIANILKKTEKDECSFSKGNLEVLFQDF